MKQQSLSKRELVLLYILLCLVLALGGWFLLLKPALDENRQLQSKHDTVSLEYQQEKNELEIYANIDSSIETANADYEMQKNNFMKIMTTEEVGKYLTETVQKYGLVPVSLSLEEPKQETIPAFVKEEEVSIKTEETKETEETKKEEGSPVYVMNVTQIISTVKLGNNTSDYIEHIKNTPGIQMTNFSCTSAQTTTVTMVYKIYMIEK